MRARPMHGHAGSPGGLRLPCLNVQPNNLANTSNLAQRAPAELRGEAIAFEREAAIANTQAAMSRTPPEVLKSSAVAVELAERLTISREQDAFRLELRGQSGQGVGGLVKRNELQRVLQMLHGVAAQAGWLQALARTGPAPGAGTGEAKPRGVN